MSQIFIVLLGSLRLIAISLVLLFGCIPTVVLGWIPVRFHGAKLSAWFVTLLTRLFNRIFSIRSTCTNPRRMARHRGLIVANHSSYLDVIALMNGSPARFMAAAEVRHMPVIGPMTAACETVYVDRKDKQSRLAARQAVTNALHGNPCPPIAIFPEGKLGPGDHLYPFHHGTFTPAIETGTAILPCAIRYNRPDVVTWYGGIRQESIVTAVWRLATHRGRISIELIPLQPITPVPGDDPASLAAGAQRQIEDALGFPPSTTTLEAESPVSPASN